MPGHGPGETGDWTAYEWIVVMGALACFGSAWSIGRFGVMEAKAAPRPPQPPHLTDGPLPFPASGANDVANGGDLASVVQSEDCMKHAADMTSGRHGPCDSHPPCMGLAIPVPTRHACRCITFPAFPDHFLPMRRTRSPTFIQRAPPLPPCAAFGTSGG